MELKIRISYPQVAFVYYKILIRHIITTGARLLCKLVGKQTDGVFISSSYKEECQHCHSNAHCVGGHCICKHGFVGDGLDCWGKRHPST